jgi:hexosaminidase
MIKYTLLFACSLLFTFQALLAQPSQNRLDPKNLHLSWEVVEEQYQGKQEALVAITLENKGQHPLPATGWSLYFNASPGFKPKDSGVPVSVEHINGDLLRLVPGESFKSIPAGASQRLEFFAGGRIFNESRVPGGFYLVWDNAPGIGHALGGFESSKPAVDKIGWIQPRQVYEQNQSIENIPVEKLPKIFPSPAQYTETTASFPLTAATPIVADRAFEREATLLATYLSTLLGEKPKVSTTGSGKALRLQKKEGLGPEAYELEVTAQGITISASAPAGAFWGTQSLKTLIPPAALENRQRSLLLPGLKVSDEPRFGHRAFMMDVARNFQQKAEVLKVLDLMALYKMNVLHFHLTDDEGWRLEIPGLPELTTVGSRRGHAVDESNSLQASLGSGPEADQSSGSGFYSRQDYLDILRYATDRHIRVIPEIETPGHARASIKAMDARYERLMKEGKKAEAERYLLRDPKDQSEYRSVQNWNDNVIDVALPSTYAFLEKVTDELLAMYKEAGAPIQTIHFGGDEVPPGVWEKSPAAQTVIANNPEVSNTDDLWYYFYGNLNEMLKKRGLYLSGWEEIAMRKVRDGEKVTYIANPDFADENFHADVWNNLGTNADLAYRLANAGYKVVLTNVTNFYLDLAYQVAYEEPGLNWGGYLDVDKPFYFIPYDYLKNLKVDAKNNPIDPALALEGSERLTEAGKANIVGIQAPLWSETITTPERLEYMLLPKLLAVAERAWAQDPQWAREEDAEKSSEAYQQAWSRFVNQLGKRELPRLSHYNGGYYYRIPTAGAVVQQGRVLANVQLPGLKIRYTTDGTEPTASSKEYTGPITEKGTIKLRVFNNNGRGGRTVAVENT